MWLIDSLTARRGGLRRQTLFHFDFDLHLLGRPLMEWTGTEGKVVRPPPSLPPSVARVALKSIAPSIHPFMMMRVASLDDLQSVRSQIRPGLPSPLHLAAILATFCIRRPEIRYSRIGDPPRTDCGEVLTLEVGEVRTCRPRKTLGLIKFLPAA